MRLAVLADVHANLPALEAVLRDVDSLSPAGLWVAGDLVGYNPWPNEVLQVLRDRHAKAIRGNHDRGVLGDDPFRFNELAAAALRWTRIQLTPGSVGYLKELEDRTRTTMPEGVVAMYHGSPRDDDEYVFPDRGRIPRPEGGGALRHPGPHAPADGPGLPVRTPGQPR